MSYSFHLNNAPKLKLSELTAAARLEGLRFVEGYPEAKDDFWPRGFTYVYQDKLTARALEIEYDGDHFQIKVFTASSAQDFMLAIELTQAVAEVCGGRITPEDQETQSLESFINHYDKDWAQQYAKRSITNVLKMFGETIEKGHQISGVTGLMTIGPRVYSQITQQPDNAPEAFFNRLRRLNYINDEPVYQSPVNVVNDPANDQFLRLSSWGENVETLLCDRNTVVGVSTGEHSMIKVSLTDIARLLGDKAVWLSEELLLVPALKSEQWQAFLQQAETVAINDLSAYCFDAENDPFHGEGFNLEGELSEQEFNLLVYAPVAVFCLVAGADRKIDSKEINAFQRELVKGVSVESKTLQKVLMEAASDFQPMVKYLLSDEVDLDSIMPRVVKVLDSRLTAQEAMHFKVSLLRIGTLVAQASGGVLGIFGDKVCKAEKSVLADLTTLFGLVESQLEE